MRSVIRILKMKNLSDACKEEQRKFVKSFDYVLSDLDGVVWTKYEVHKCAAECMNTLKAMGKSIHYVTNNSTANSEDLAAILRLNKFEAKDEDVTNPQITLIDHLKEIKFQGTLYTLVTENFREQIRKAGFTVAPSPEHPVEESLQEMVKNARDDPDVKGVLNGVDINVTFIKLQKALTYLKRDDCIFLTTGTDMAVPVGSIGPMIGPGIFAHILSSLSQREPTNVSKPSILSCAHINRKLGIRMPNRVLFIGDYISQDMYMAAMGGYQKLLVLSGDTKLKDIQNWTHPEEWKPQYYVEDLNALYNVIKGLDFVAWVRAEDQTILSLHTRVVTHNNRIGVTHDDLEMWRLRIRPVKESDRGCYLCQINTPVLKSQKSCLDVFVPPDILNEDTSGDMSVSEGENTTLICKAAGHPTPRITWRREDGQPILIRKGHREYAKVETCNGSSLHFWRLDRKQMGAYLCIASNDIPPAVSKRISLSVNFAPVIKVPNQLLGAPLNTDVQLECYVEAYPNTINYWIKNRGEMLLNGTKYTIREDRSGYKVFMWLVIRSFSPSDIGTYNCVSTNSLGRAEGTLRLYEIKVGPVSHNNHVIVGGLAEPARGHRSAATSLFERTCPAMLIAAMSLQCFR